MMCKAVEVDRERCMPLLWGIYKSTMCRAFSKCIPLPKDFDVDPIGKYHPLPNPFITDN